MVTYLPGYLNGNQYEGSILGEKIGPSFRQGDTVGLGMRQSNGAVFVTHNGKLVGMLCLTVTIENCTKYIQ